MTEKVRNLIQEVLEKQVQVEQARYKQLQTQINPHFLYSTLETIRMQAISSRNREGFSTTGCSSRGRITNR